MRRALAFAGLLAVAGCAPAPWHDATFVAEHFGPYTPAAFAADEAEVRRAGPHAAAARLMLAGVDASTVEAGRAVVLRCARSSVALSFSTADLPAGVAARPGDVLLVRAGADGRSRVVRVLTGPLLPAGQRNWHDGMSVPRPDAARYVHWRSDRWIVRCHQPGVLKAGDR